MRSCTTTWDTRQRQHCTFQSWKAHFSVLAVFVSLLPQRVSFSTEQWLSHGRKRFCLLEKNRIEGIMTVTRCSSGLRGHQNISAYAVNSSNCQPWGPGGWCSRCSDVQSHRIPDLEGTLETILARGLYYVWGTSVFPKCNSGIAKESGGISLKQ